MSAHSEHLIRHLWCRVMLDSRTPVCEGMSAYRAASFVADMLGTSSLDVGLAVGIDRLLGWQPLPSREALARDAAILVGKVAPSPTDTRDAGRGKTGVGR